MDLGSWFDQNSAALASLGFYAVGIICYTLLVTLLYVPMGHRLMFGRKTREGEDRVVTSGRRTMYVLFFPLVSFSFFLVIAAALCFLAASTNSTLTAETALTISMAIVLAIRVVAYFNEGAAQELGKIMPLGLLGFVLVTNDFNTLGSASDTLRLMFDRPDLMGVYFLIVVLVEYLLRAIWAIFNPPAKPPKVVRPQGAVPPAPRSGDARTGALRR